MAQLFVLWTCQAPCAMLAWVSVANLTKHNLSRHLHRKPSMHRSLQASIVHERKGETKTALQPRQKRPCHAKGEAGAMPCKQAPFYFICHRRNPKIADNKAAKVPFTKKAKKHQIKARSHSESSAASHLFQNRTVETGMRRALQNTLSRARPRLSTAVTNLCSYEPRTKKNMAAFHFSRKDAETMLSPKYKKKSPWSENIIRIMMRRLSSASVLSFGKKACVQCCASSVQRVCFHLDWRYVRSAAQAQLSQCDCIWNSCVPCCADSVQWL